MKTVSFRIGTPFVSLKTALLGALLLAATTACKKDTDTITPGGSASSSLAVAGKNLRLTALTFSPAVDLNGDGKPDSDLMPFMEDCALDNTINFEKNGKLSGSEGAKVCPGDGSDDLVSVEPSTWTYNPDTRILRIVPTGNPAEATEWNVQDVSANMIKAAIASESADGDQMSIIMTWQAQ